MKAILITLFLSLTIATQAQTRKPIVNGYTLLLDGIYIRVDTVENRTQVYNHTGEKVFVTINEGKERELIKNGVMTVWNDSFVLTVKRKKVVKSYNV